MQKKIEKPHINVCVTFMNAHIFSSGCIGVRISADAGTGVSAGIGLHADVAMAAGI